MMLKNKNIILIFIMLLGAMVRVSFHGKLFVPLVAKKNSYNLKLKKYLDTKAITLNTVII